MIGPQRPIAVSFAIPDDGEGEIILKFPPPPPLKLTDEQKQEVLAELSSKLRTRDSVYSLSVALQFLQMYNITPPSWVYDRLQSLIRNRWEEDRRTRAKEGQRIVDQIRWGAVRHLRSTRRLSWEKAYAAASDDLRGTASAGSDASMKASYQKHQRSARIKRIVADDGADALSYWAQLAYENRATGDGRWVVAERDDEPHRVSP